MGNSLKNTFTDVRGLRVDILPPVVPLVTVPPKIAWNLLKLNSLK